MPQHVPDYIEQLAEKLLLGIISKEERAILDKWYNEQPKTAPVWDLNHESKEELGDRLFVQIQQQVKIVKWRLPIWAKISAAASLVLTLSFLLTIYLSHRHQPSNELYSIAGIEGGIKKVLLPDQSIVWLKGNSRLEYPATFSDSTRNVTLHGEALFEVSKDKKHPFIILAGNYITRVVGTSFNIKENHQSQSFKLTVLTGKVLVLSVKNNNATVKSANAVLVTPGKEFESLSASSTSLISMAQPSVKAAVVQGTEYLMDFENTSFKDIKSRIEHKFDVAINSTDNIYSKCDLSANVTDQSLDNTLKVICAAMGANYTVLNNKITITGGGCN